MGKPAPLRIDRILPRTEGGSDYRSSALLTPAEAQAVLRVAFLAGEADGRIADEEQDTFHDLSVALRKLTGDDAQMKEDVLEKMLDTLTNSLEKSGIEACLKDAARALARPLAKDLAYKVAVAMSLSDLDRSDSESDFDDQLVAALGLTDEQADTLSGDVYAALEDGE
jgi:tellurite resistance protein